MSFPAALGVIKAMIEVGSIDPLSYPRTLNPSQVKQAHTVRELHWFLKHTNDYFYSNSRSLADRLQSASTAAMHLLFLQRKYAPFNYAWFIDQQLQCCVH